MSSFDIFLDHESQLVKITALGEFFKKDGEEMITVARKTAMKHSYNVFYDIRQATTTVSFASWFNLPRELEVFKFPETRKIKAALLVSPTDKAVDDYKFYEIVTGNIGINIRVFFDETEALEWIMPKSKINTQS